MAYVECYVTITWLTFRLAHILWLKTGTEEDGQAARTAFEAWAQAFGLEPDQVPEPSHNWKKVP